MPECDEIYVDMNFIGFQHMIRTWVSPTEYAGVFILDLSVHNMNSKSDSS
jgi:hypothetical protein